MKKIIYVLALAVLASCSNNKKEKSEVAYSATPTGLSGLQNTASATAPASNAATTGLMLNPEHGKPGHRCDLAVGAPLNSAPAQATPAPTPQPTATQTVTPQVSTPTATTPSVNEKGQKLNPPHGQPGHRCEIAVGAPLDSKPVQTSVTTTATPAVTSTSAPSTAPMATTNAKGQKLNPAHGQPGHKCEVAVGAPLT